jgi:hypothetical protein
VLLKEFLEKGTCIVNWISSEPFYEEVTEVGTSNDDDGDAVCYSLGRLVNQSIILLPSSFQDTPSDSLP